MNGYDGLGSASRDFLELNLSAEQLEAFQTYLDELLAWNSRFNLTAITDPVEIEIKHFLDSLSCYRVIKFQADDRVVDIGTGAGLPGIPLKILCPSIQLTLVESVGKKADFCEHVIENLELSGVHVVRKRAEAIGRDEAFRASFDWAVARAVAVAPVLLEYMLPLLTIDGRGVMQKGSSGPQEIHSAAQALAILGGEVLQVTPIELPKVPETRFLILIRKCAATPEKYPRRPGIPSKRPLV